MGLEYIGNPVIILKLKLVEIVLMFVEDLSSSLFMIGWDFSNIFVFILKLVFHVIELLL